MPTPKKEAAVAEVREEMDKARGVVVISFRGLSVPLMTQLRAQLGKSDARMAVVKNRLARIALDGTPAASLAEVLTGPKALTFCYGDVPPAVKTLSDFAKDHGGVTLEASYLEGTVFGQSQTEALADVPTKPELLSSMLGALNSPITGLVFTLQGIISDFVYTLQAVADQKADESTA